MCEFEKSNSCCFPPSFFARAQTKRTANTKHLLTPNSLCPSHYRSSSVLTQSVPPCSTAHITRAKHVHPPKVTTFAKQASCSNSASRRAVLFLTVCSSCLCLTLAHSMSPFSVHVCVCVCASICFTHFTHLSWGSKKDGLVFFNKLCGQLMCAVPAAEVPVLSPVLRVRGIRDTATWPLISNV